MLAPTLISGDVLLKTDARRFGKSGLESHMVLWMLLTDNAIGFSWVLCAEYLKNGWNIEIK